MGGIWQRPAAALAVSGVWLVLSACAGVSASAEAPAEAADRQTQGEASPDSCRQDCREIRQICLRRLTVPSPVPRSQQATNQPPVDADAGDLALERRCNRAYDDCMARCQEERADTEEVAPLP